MGELTFYGSLQIINPRAVRVIVCDGCGALVAQDLGRPIDVALVAQAIESHINHPRTDLTRCLNHRLATLEMGTMAYVPGVRLWEKAERVM